MNIKAKPIVDGKFWVIEQDGDMVGTLRKQENNKFMLSSSGKFKYFNKKDELTKLFGKDFFAQKAVISHKDVRDIQGYPTNCYPHNTLFNVKEKLPLFTKSESSKSLYCAGYYVIKFEKNWARAFCPKLITLERYPYKGPFKTEEEMKQTLTHVKAS